MAKRILIKIISSLLMRLLSKYISSATLMDSKGRFIQPFNPGCRDIDLEVVALALSRIKRFFGQTKLSVAQHSVNMARVFIHLGEYEYAKEALLHEIAEAFMGDLASPLKRAFPMFKEIEESLIKKTFDCYGLSYPMAKSVHVLDKSIMINEAVEHMPNADFWNSLGSKVDEKLLQAAQVDLTPWSDEDAFKEFMTTASILKLV